MSNVTTGKLLNVLGDIRLIGLVVIVLVSITVFVPIAAPVQISAPVRGFYDQIQSLGPDSVVLLYWGVTKAMMSEQGPTAVAMIRQLLARGPPKIIIHSRDPVEDGLMPLLRQYFGGAQDSPLYGKKFVYLGVLPGRGALIDRMMIMLQFASNIRSVFAKDYFGNDLDTLPIMNGINDFSKANLDIMTAMDSLDHEAIVYKKTYSMPIIACGSASETAEALSVYYAGLVDGVVGGTKGGAEYEAISGYIGENMAVIGGMFLIALFVFFFTAVNNIQYYRRKYLRQKTPVGGEGTP